MKECWIRLINYYYLLIVFLSKILIFGFRWRGDDVLSFHPQKAEWPWRWRKTILFSCSLFSSVPAPMATIATTLTKINLVGFSPPRSSSSRSSFSSARCSPIQQVQVQVLTISTLSMKTHCCFFKLRICFYHLLFSNFLEGWFNNWMRTL